MATHLADKSGLTRGTAEFESVGPITFSPDGILFVADNARARIVAIDLGEEGGRPRQPIDVDDLDVRLAALLGCELSDVDVRDLAVNPRSGATYLAVMRGHDVDAIPLLIEVSEDGSLSELKLDDVAFSETAVEAAPAIDDERQSVRVAHSSEKVEEYDARGTKLMLERQPMRAVTVTDMAFADGVLLVAGASNEEFVSRLRRIPFPFRGEAESSSLEIFHVSHGRYETASPIRTFVPYAGKSSILASYTCTPVVYFRLADLTDGAKAVGRTVAELGPVNQPLDMVSFVQDGEEYLLVANSAHGLVKIACRDIDTQSPLTEPQQPVGVPRETKDLQGVRRLANLGGSYVLALQSDDAGRQHLRSLKTASL